MKKVIADALVLLLRVVSERDGSDSQEWAQQLQGGRIEPLYATRPAISDGTLM